MRRMQAHGDATGGQSPFLQAARVLVERVVSHIAHCRSLRKIRHVDTESLHFCSNDRQKRPKPVHIHLTPTLNLFISLLIGS
jgi:hypothetical protein